VWRTWLVAPEHHRRGAAEPILTGLFGYPWRRAELDAHCTRDEPVPTATHRARHHPIVPHPECTCGIYAGRDELITARIPQPAAAQPFAAGFVELSGRILLGPTGYRAQRATIVGPLTLGFGRRPHLLLGAARTTPPVGVRITPHRYRAVWRTRRGVAPLGEWLEETAAALRQRYGVPVVA
jgi:hypothetical protein